jgi:hypothetical protein
MTLLPTAKGQQQLIPEEEEEKDSDLPVSECRKP